MNVRRMRGVAVASSAAPAPAAPVLPTTDSGTLALAGLGLALLRRSGASD
jgi:hypothetical protein